MFIKRQYSLTSTAWSPMGLLIGVAKIKVGKVIVVGKKEGLRQHPIA